MKLIVAVKSCHRDREAGFHDAIRETWGRDLALARVPVIFFMGEHPDRHKGATAVLKGDEVIVGAEDDYKSLPHKTRGIAQWAHGKLFGHLFLCDNDTFVNAKGLLALPFELFDYSGHFRGGQDEVGTTFYYKDHVAEYMDCHPWASGGMGYFLSNAAVQLVSESYPKVWAEDMYVGQVLGREIQRGDMMGGALQMAGATSHYRKSPKDPAFTPGVLRRIYHDGGPEKLYAECNAK